MNTSPAVDRVLTLLRDRGPVTLKGENWSCICPAHEDAKPSLDVKAGRDGRVLLQCRSRNCSPAAITAAIVPDSLALVVDNHAALGVEPGPAEADLAETGAVSDDDATLARHFPWPQWAALHDVLDEDRHVVG